LPGSLNVLLKSRMYGRCTGKRFGLKWYRFLHKLPVTYIYSWKYWVQHESESI